MKDKILKFIRGLFSMNNDKDKVVPTPTPTPMPTPTPIPQTPKEYIEPITKASEEYGVPSNILSANLYVESSFDPDVISGNKKSPKGAVGIAQFTPIALEELKRLGYKEIDPTKPEEAIPASAFFLSKIKDQIGNDDWLEAIKAYNAGVGNYKKYRGNIPFVETKRHIEKIKNVLGYE